MLAKITDFGSPINLMKGKKHNLFLFSPFFSFFLFSILIHSRYISFLHFTSLSLRLVFAQYSASVIEIVQTSPYINSYSSSLFEAIQPQIPHENSSE